MSTSSDHEPAVPARSGQPSTQEIPIVPPEAVRPATGGHHLPPPGAPPTAGVPVEAAQPTGPVDFVPGLPGLGTPPPPPPVAAQPVSSAVAPGTEPGPEAPRTAPVTAPALTVDTPSWPDSLESDAARPSPRVTASRVVDRKAIAGLGLAALAVVLLQVGLLLRFDSVSFWSAVTLWSAFATLASVLSLVAFAAFYPAGNRLRSAAVWRIAAAGLVGLSVFWVLVVLPVVASDRGFVLTAALGCLGGALWIGPRRKD